MLDAIVAGDAGRVKAILDAGADPNHAVATPHAGEIPLLLIVAAAATSETADRRAMLRVGRVLIDGGARLDPEPGYKPFVLAHSVIFVGPGPAAFLLELGADVNAVNGTGHTALMAAAMGGDTR